METVLKWKLWTPVHLWQTCYLFLVSLYDTHYKPNYPKAHSFLVNFVSKIMMDRKWFHVNQHIFPTLPYRQMKLRRIRSMQKRGVCGGCNAIFSLMGKIWTRLRAVCSCKRGESLFNSVTLKAMRSSSGDREEEEGWVGGTWQGHVANDKTEWDQYEWKLSFKHYLPTETLKHI